MKKDTFKNNARFLVDLQKEAMMNYTTLLDPITKSSENLKFVHVYSGNSFQQYL